LGRGDSCLAVKMSLSWLHVGQAIESYFIDFVYV